MVAEIKKFKIKDGPDVFTLTACGKGKGSVDFYSPEFAVEVRMPMVARTWMVLPSEPFGYEGITITQFPSRAKEPYKFVGILSLNYFCGLEVYVEYSPSSKSGWFSVVGDIGEN